MASNHQRHINLSHFLSSGNTIPTAQDVATEPDYSIDDDLARFTDAEFDFDPSDILNAEAALDLNLAEDESRGQTDNKELDSTADFAFPPLDPFTIPTSPIPTPFPFSTQPLPQPSSQPYPASRTSQPYSPSSSFPLFPSPPPTNPNTNNNPLNNTTPEPARHAAEEDKRRRNTAASARFRVKKKQREQALEKTAEELKARAQELEQRVRGLETENEWLRGLVVGKGGRDEGGGDGVS